jgi:ABC-2 type transport system ATP-binding protein
VTTPSSPMSPMAPMPPTTPSISVTSVSKWYHDVLAVNEVSAEFGPGVTGLLGPNGAGKSTLLKVIVGMLAPSIGSVTVLGETPFDNPGVMRRVGLCPEQDAVYPRATAIETLIYLTRLHGYAAGEAAARATDALVRVGLEGAMDRPASGFSKGMRQRLKVAQALAHGPDVIVLDEPLNGLDPVARRDMTALIRSLGEDGRCVLVSSHVLHEIEAMTRRVLLMSQGRVVAEGTIEEIRRELSDRPLSVRVDSTNPRALAVRVVSLEGVARVDLRVAALDVMTTKPELLFRTLAAWGAAGEAPVTSWRPMDEGLEAVFRYLTTEAS